MLHLLGWIDLLCCVLFRIKCGTSSIAGMLIKLLCSTSSLGDLSIGNESQEIRNIETKRQVRIVPFEVVKSTRILFR